jgi:hypothetical protein
MPSQWQKAESGRPPARGRQEPPESLARGTLSQGFAKNLGDLPVSSCKIGCGLPDTKDQALAGTDAPANGANKHLVEEVAGDRGKPEIVREGLGRSLITP